MFIIFNSDPASFCEGDFVPASNRDYCSSRPYAAYLRTYAIILGNMALEDFRKDPVISIIFVLITFFAWIIMLNVLIAGKVASGDPLPCRTNIVVLHIFPCDSYWRVLCQG